MTNIKRAFFNTLDYFVDVAALGGLGLLAGRVVNYVVKVAHPSLLPKPPYVDNKSAAAFCAIFIAIDQLIQPIFASLLGRGESERISFSAFRLGTSFSLGLLLNPSFISLLKSSPLKPERAGVIVALSLTVYSLCIRSIQIINLRH